MAKRPLPDAFQGKGHTLNGDSALVERPQKKVAPVLDGASAMAAAAATKASFWLERIAPSCPHGSFGNPKASSKIAAFDLDGTVIEPLSGNKFPKDANDWKFHSKFPTVTSVLKQLVEDGFTIVFISNQAGHPKQQKHFLDKLPLIALRLKTVPFHAIAAFGYDQFRKPSPGMWDAFTRRFNDGIPIDYEKSFYVGDAAGRLATAERDRDHSDCDRKMALNAGLTFYTPEEFFLKRPVETVGLTGFDAGSYDHSVPLFKPSSTPLVPKRSQFITSPPDVVLFIGYPASGKTTLYQKYFGPANYVHINQDTLKTRLACLKLLRTSLAASPPRSCVIDNTNPAAATRAEYLSLVRAEFGHLGVRVRAFVFDAEVEVAKHNSVWRALKGGREEGEGGREVLPAIAFSTFRSHLQEVKAEEGFDEIKHIAFKIEAEEERKDWAKWLVDVYPKGKSK